MGGGGGAILVIARLCEPSSELQVAEQWYRSTGLEDLLQVPAESVYDERLNRTLHRLLPHKEAIEQHLVKRFGELFALDYDLLLYDVSSTYFEGVADSAIAQRGYSRDHQPDCVQVNIALVVTRGGMPLGYEIFPGNTADVTTVEEIVSAMEARFGKVNRVWVMDRGMVSAENIAWLNQTHRRYVIGTLRAELKRWARQLADKTDWRRIREDVEVKLCRGPQGNETFLLCRSAARVEKERAMHERFSQRIEAGLQSMARRIEQSTRRLDPKALERQIGRLLERNARAAARYLITIEDDKSSDSGLGLTWRAHAEWDEWAISPRAPTFFAATCTSGATKSCGRPTSSSPKPKRPSASTNPISPSARSGTRKPRASRPTSWCAFSATRCGRRSRSGSRAPAWVIRRAPSSPSSRASQLPISRCRLPMARDENCAFAVSCVRIAVKRFCLIDWVFACRSNFARPKPSKRSGDFGP